MAKKDNLKNVGAKIGAALGKAEKEARVRARKVAKAGGVAKEELREISKQVLVLQKQLARATQRLKRALR